MINLTDSALEAIRKDSEQGVSPGMGDVQLMIAQIRQLTSSGKDLLVERQALAGLLKRFVDGEHDLDENQAERHMYHDEAQTLLAFLGGDLPGHTLVPDAALRAQHDQLKTKTETYCTYGDKGNEHTYYGDQAAITALTALAFEVEALRKNSDRYQWLRDKSESVHQFYLSTPIWFTGVKFSKENVDSTIDAAMTSVATQFKDAGDVSRHEN